MGGEICRGVPEPRVELGEGDAHRPGRIGDRVGCRRGCIADALRHACHGGDHAGSRSFEDHPPDSPTVSGSAPEFTNPSTIAGTRSRAVTTIGAGGSARRNPSPYWRGGGGGGRTHTAAPAGCAPAR